MAPTTAPISPALTGGMWLEAGWIAARRPASRITSRVTDQTTVERLSARIEDLKQKLRQRRPGKAYQRGNHGAPAKSPTLFTIACCAAAWCDQIPTPAENQIYPYSRHSCAPRRPCDFGKLFVETSD